MDQKRRDELEKQMMDIKTELLIMKKDEIPKSKVPRDTKFKCDICGGSYSYTNKSGHCKTKKHIAELEHMKELRRAVRSRTFQGRALHP